MRNSKVRSPFPCRRRPLQNSNVKLLSFAYFEETSFVVFLLELIANITSLVWVEISTARRTEQFYIIANINPFCLWCHFRHCFCRGPQRKVPRILTHVQNDCVAYSAFCLSTFLNCLQMSVLSHLPVYLLNIKSSDTSLENFQIHWCSHNKRKRHMLYRYKD